MVDKIKKKVLYLVHDDEYIVRAIVFGKDIKEACDKIKTIDDKTLVAESCSYVPLYFNKDELAVLSKCVVVLD